MIAACARCGLCHPADRSCLALTIPVGMEHDLLPVDTVLAGRYRVLSVIHRGGMNTVYLAADVLQRQQVVLKELRLPPDTSAADRREAEVWFARESYLLSSLRSPLIPQFFSVFQDGGYSYIVQEYVEGENLDRAVAQRGPLGEDLVLRWGVALCDLLSYLHEQDEPVIYRDLKPANILWRAGGSGVSGAERQLAVVDFGIARPYHHGEVGTVIGTPGYAPPEQYQGLATPQSDVYALGATLHRLLTGYDPEHGPPFSFPPVRQMNPRISPELAAVVERGLQLAPSGRFDSARAMGAALSDLLQERSSWLGMPARTALGLSSPIRGGWVAPLVGTLLLGPMLLAMLGSFLSQPQTGSVVVDPVTVVLLQGQPGAPGSALNPTQGWAPDPGGNSVGAPGQQVPVDVPGGSGWRAIWGRDGRAWSLYDNGNARVWIGGR